MLSDYVKNMLSGSHSFSLSHTVSPTSHPLFFPHFFQSCAVFLPLSHLASSSPLSLCPSPSLSYVSPQVEHVGLML